MRLKLIAFLFIFSGCATVGNNKDNLIDVAYSESADIFDLMDQTANWWPGFTEDVYQSEWKKRFGKLSNLDKDFFKKYKDLRTKYYDKSNQKERNPLKNKNGFFSKGGTEIDPIAAYFYSSDTMKDAFIKTRKLVTQSELNFLKSFYSHFSSRYMTLVDESKKNFPISVKNIKNSMRKPGIPKYLNKVAKFYNTQSRPKYRVLFTWWPPTGNSQATPSGNFLLFRVNPIENYNDEYADIVSHEVIHTISRDQPHKQKQELTKQFLENCDVKDKVKSGKILEEPLAVIFGQLIYNKYFQPKAFDFSSNLYRSSWIKTMARALYVPTLERFEKGETINDGFIEDASKICSDLVQTLKEIKN